MPNASLFLLAYYGEKLSWFLGELGSGDGPCTGGLAIPFTISPKYVGTRLPHRWTGGETLCASPATKSSDPLLHRPRDPLMHSARLGGKGALKVLSVWGKQHWVRG